MENNMEDLPENTLKGLSEDVGRHLSATFSVDPKTARSTALYQALALSVRDRLGAQWHVTQSQYQEHGSKQVYYLSMEYLMGRSLTNAVHNLNLEQPVRQALLDYGIQLEELEQQERDAGLGNGGVWPLVFWTAVPVSNFR